MKFKIKNHVKNGALKSNVRITKFNVFDADLKAVYHGQLDESRPGNSAPLNGQDIRNAINNLLKGKEPVKNQKPSMGCGIKWK